MFKAHFCLSIAENSDEEVSFRDTKENKNSESDYSGFFIPCSLYEG